MQLHWALVAGAKITWRNKYTMHCCGAKASLTIMQEIPFQNLLLQCVDVA